MSETYNKLNDYTLEVVQRLGDSAMSAGSFNAPSDYRLTRIFNFGAGQVTTLARHYALSTSSAYSSHNSTSMASSVQMSVQDFTDLPSTYEVEAMHKKLIELKGNPPALDSVLSDRKTTTGKPKLGAPAR